MKPVNWTDNAREKLRLVQNQGFIIDEDLVLNAIRQPRRVDEGYWCDLAAGACLPKFPVWLVIERDLDFPAFCDPEEDEWR